MRAHWATLVWACAALPVAFVPLAHADDSALPTCSALVPALRQDASSVRNGEPLLSVDAIVLDLTSTPDMRTCTAVGHYKSGTSHITYTARWFDDQHKTLDINGHETTTAEAFSRAHSLRMLDHPKGLDGTYSLDYYVPYCTDPEFIRRATAELHYGVSFRDTFYKEPDLAITDIRTNGYGSGILSNCIATIKDGDQKGDIFIGTNWVNAETATRYEFYVLADGPGGFALKNRLWETGAE